MLDLLITNGLVIDGSGSPGFFAAVLVEGDNVTVLRGDVSHLDPARTIDASGQVVGVAGLPDAEVADALELMDVLADAEATRACTATQFFRSGFGREPEGDADGCLTADLEDLLAESDGDLHELMVGLARSADFRHKRIPE